MINLKITLTVLLACCHCMVHPRPVDAETTRKTENVIVVVLDGVRWQEVFRGADESLINAERGGVWDVQGRRDHYWRDTAVARRETLLPFLWGTVAMQGQIFGEPERGAAARCANSFRLSYPGYSELFCGVADPRVDSNDKKDNPNLSVLEYLNGLPAVRDKVEVVCTWDVFPWIFRVPQSGLRVHAGWGPLREGALTPRERYANEFLEWVPRVWTDNAFDAFAMEATRSALERRKSRVLFVGLGETDEWGHGRRYDLYLDAAANADRFLAETWNALQQNAQYKDKTALIVTTDHGRGSTPADWTDHGPNVPGAEFIWIAIMGPDTPPLGVRENVEVTQAQVAATIATLLGEDFLAARSDAAKPLPIFAE